MPADPFEAELLAMAGALVDKDRGDEDSEDSVEDTSAWDDDYDNGVVGSGHMHLSHAPGETDIFLMCLTFIPTSSLVPARDGGVCTILVGGIATPVQCRPSCVNQVDDVSSVSSADLECDIKGGRVIPKPLPQVTPDLDPSPQPFGYSRQPTAPVGQVTPGAIPGRPQQQQLQPIRGQPIKRRYSSREGKMVI